MRRSKPPIENALDHLVDLYGEVDRLTGQLYQLHAARLMCRRGCHACCVDDLTVFEIEAESIRRSVPDLLRSAPPHPPGHCAFLDLRGHCRIYHHRPYVCRTQGLPLRWFDETPSGELVEYRDICPLNDGDPPLEELEETACWLVGPYEARLAGIQKDLDSGTLKRVALRSLFAQSPR